MLSLRQRQIREILDEDKRIYRQVFDKEQEQVKVFTETVAPKGERDIDAEFRTASLSEGIKKILEDKITNAELLISTPKTGTFDISYNEKQFGDFVKNGDLVKAYNEIVRIVNNPALDNSAKEINKVKLQEIAPTINALTYLARRLISDAIEPERVVELTSGDLSPVLRRMTTYVTQFTNAYSVYVIIQNQLFRNQFRPIETSDINSQYAKTVNEFKAVGLPTEEIDTIGEWRAYGDRGSTEKQQLLNYIYTIQDATAERVGDFTQAQRELYDEEARQRGINYVVPERNEIDRQVRIEFPGATEEERRAVVDFRLRQDAQRRIASSLGRYTEPVAPIDFELEQATAPETRGAPVELPILPTERETQERQRLRGRVSPIVAPETEVEVEPPVGRGRAPRFSNRLNKVLKFNDERNEMYDY